MTQPPPPVDIAANPYLNGCFAPVTDEGAYSSLVVTSGEIPADLDGTYIRNGPNPRFTPLGAYVYPVDGDGMVHAVTLKHGKAAYQNRFVRTPMMSREEEVGHAVWAGVTTGYTPDAEQTGPDLVGLWKDLPGINVVRHHGEVIALAEMSRSYRLGGNLQTLEVETYGGVLPQGTCAHPKVDPVTGEMFVFTYDVAPPYLQWAAIGVDGTVVNGPHPVEIPQSCMIHDFAITETSIVLIVNPFVFDLEAAMAGGSPLAWRPELGCQIAVISRANGSVAWHHGDPFWAWHFANAYDLSGGVVVDAVVWDRPELSDSESESHPVRGRFSRLTLPGDSDAIRHTEIIEQTMEFPRIDDRLIGRAHKQVAVGAKTDPEMPSGQYNNVMTIDPLSGSTNVFDAGNMSVGEPCFVPPASGDGSGYFVTFATDRTTLKSSFLILPADDVSSGPIATVEIPVRVPLGLHGAWLPTQPS